MADRIFGPIPGYPPGTVFSSRAALHAAGVHRPLQKGISGSKAEGADSIVLSGGYADDTDFGDEILYTGEGGRDPATGDQVRDQRLNRGNLALARSSQLGLPVRVIRGAGAGSRYAPEAGYRYDGLYRVASFWMEEGVAGYYVWRFRLVKAYDAAAPAVAEGAEPYDAVPRAARFTTRIVRDTEQSRRLKRRYDYRCQVCGERLEGAAGPYAEAAHIRPLGRPHHGPDAPENLLCLCPNHHVLFDYGAFTIADDLTLLGAAGSLILARGHALNSDYLAYHRTLWHRDHADP